MIAVRGRERRVGGASFRDATAYIRGNGRTEAPLAEWSHGVASIDSAAVEMEAVAGEAPRLARAVYHLIASWSPGERPTFEQAREAADGALRGIGFAAPQYVAALHDDGVGGCVHLHVVANRRAACTMRRVSTQNDYAAMTGAMRATEVRQGWMRVETAERARVGRDLYGAHRRFVELVRRELRERVGRALQAEPTWQRFHAVLAELECRYEVVAVRAAAALRASAAAVQGRVVSIATGVAAAVRELGFTHDDLCRRLGAYVAAAHTAHERDVAGVRERGAAIARAVMALDVDSRSWEAVHALAAEQGLAIARTSVRNTRLIVSDRGSGASIFGDECGLALRRLEGLVGGFVGSEESARAVAARERLHAREDRALARRLIADPSPIVKSLFARASICTLGDLDDDLSGRLRDLNEIARVREAVLGQLVAVRAPEAARRSNADWGLRLTVRPILAEESEVERVSATLARAPMARPVAVLGEASGDVSLSEEQEGARQHAIDQSSRLKVITGVPGSGKSTLIRAAARDLEASGYAVRCVSVTNKVVSDLRRDTGLPCATIASELWHLERGTRTLGELDVVIVDEVSLLGTEDAASLLGVIERSGASIICLGDDRQFSGVARGDALRLTLDACERAGHARVDLRSTIRQRTEWMRAATGDLRAGRVREGLDRYRAHGCLHELSTQDDARTSLVARWAVLESRGVRTGIAVLSNAERKAINAAAREQWRELGRLHGDDRSFETIDGVLPFAVGDRVCFREKIFGTDILNGSEASIVAIDGSVWTVAVGDREWRVNVTEHPGVQYGYAVTEYREQGATRACELVLLTPGVTARSLLVGATRHRDEYEMFYSREKFRDGLETVIERASRFEEKVMARDCSVLDLDAREYVALADAGALVSDEAIVEDLSAQGMEAE